VTASKLTGALPAISGANLTGIAATDNVRTGILDVAGIATFRNNVNIGAAVTISESGIEASGIGITCANINGTQIGGRRNIIINGAMQIAQRGTSSAGGEGYKTVDRFQYYKSGTNETPNQAQVDVAAGTTPYTLGFRKAYQVENGNQSSAGGSDLVFIETNLEAQDIANSGWNYLSSSSYITLSFWVKSSVAQNFYGYLLTVDGTAYKYPFETGSLSANTWTKVTKTIPGNSNLQFDNDSNKGLGIVWWPFLGDGYTDSGVSLNTWATWASGTRTPDATNTWYLTNNATFELTGVQLEVGPQATPFEHLSFGEDLALCQRYFYKTYNYNDAPGTADFTGTIHGRNYDGASARSDNPINVIFPTRMRADPTITWYAGDGQSNRYSTGAGAYGSNLTTEATVGTSFINSEIGVTAASFSESVPALQMYAYHITAESEI
jgi:hypothetical protein